MARIRSKEHAGRILLMVAALLAGLLCSSCGKTDAKKPRTQTHLTTGQPVKISELASPRLARGSQGKLALALFIHSAFPSATEAADAISVLASADRGAAWQETGRIPSHVTYGVWGSDLAADERDGLCFTWAATLHKADSPIPFKAIMFSRSDDGGRTWGEPARVSQATTGQRRNPVMAVHGDAVHVAWLDQRPRTPGVRAASPIEDVYVASSHDRGATWSAGQCIETDLNRKTSSSGVPSLCVGTDGTAYCAYFSMRRYRKNEGGFWLAKSTDGGKTFTTGLFSVGPLGGLDLIEADGKLYLAAVYIRGIRQISMQNPQTYQEIRLYASSDGGATWSKPVVIDDDPTHQHKSNVRLVSLGLDKLAACWHDERGGVYMAASVDGGKTWGKNVRVAPASTIGITPLDIVSDPRGGTFQLVLSDVRKGKGDATFFLGGRIAE